MHFEIGKKVKPARGREQFANALRRAGVPKEYIGNARFWRAGNLEQNRDVRP